MFWESGIKNIQQSRNVFTVELESNEALLEKYPWLEGTLGQSDIDIAKYVYDDNVDTESLFIKQFFDRYTDLMIQIKPEYAS